MGNGSARSEREKMTIQPSSSTAVMAPSTREVGAHAAFTLFAGTYGPGELRVTSFRCSERMSRPFSLDVVVSARGLDPSAIPATLLGRAATLAIPLPDAAPRLFHGVVTRVEPVSVLLHDRTSLRLRISPRLALLRHRQASRIFQNVTVREVLELLLTEMEVPHRFELSSAYPKRAYCLQYEETDLAFLSRLCGEEGIFYRFDHGDEPHGAEVVVFADDASAYPPIAGDPVLIHRASDGSGGMRAEENHAQHLSLRWSTKPTSVLLMDHDFQRPLLRLEATAAVPAHGEAQGAITAELTGANVAAAPPARPPGQVHEHHGDYEETDVARRTAGTRLAQYRRRAVVGRGESACRRLASGARFTLEEHDVDTLNGEYVLTRVDHEGATAEAAAGGEPLYRNRFACAPAALPFRPPRPRRRVTQVVETAVVVGPAGQEIHTDGFGRIKVQFHWDRDGKRNEHSSCWIRVSQAWAGAGWGAQFIPRIGMEVLVTFLGGDVDRPIVTGCVYNAVNPPPFSLPANKARSGFVTRSTPGGGGGNELSFQDDGGKEQIRLHAQRDLDEEVRRRHTTLVGEHQITEVRGHQRNEVSGDQRERVSGDRHGEIQGDQREHVHGRRTLLVERDEERRIVGNRTTTVHGLSKEIVEGDAVALYRDGYALQIDGQATTTIGAQGDAGRSDLYVFGDHVTGAEGHLTLSAKKSITLQCGDSILTLTPEGLKIGGKVLALAGAESASIQGKGPALHLGDEAELVAKTIRLFGKKASLELNEDAHLRGSTVKLNCDTAAPPEEDPETGRKQTKPLKVRLSDVAMAAYANKAYRLVIGGDVFEGTTGASGEVEREIPEAATSATLTVWLEDYPEGPRQQITLQIKELAPPDAAAGAALRLRNLGYYTGTVNEAMRALPDAAVEGLREFQRDQGLETTGKLDGPTAAKLKSVYGH